MVDIASLNARIGQIESRIAALKGAPASTTTATTSASGAQFQAALTRAAATPAAAAAPTGPVKLNSAGIPTDLAAYGNGKVPASALSSIGQGDHKLWGPAAQAFTAMSAAAKRDGIDLKVSDSYRSYSEQVDVARRKGLYSQGGLAAKPGTSDHGWGLSLDLSMGDRALGWMRANGAKFGFDENVPRESWHWTYSPKR